MSKLIKYFRRDERGATATEYAMLIVFVAVAIAAGANLLGQGVSSLFSQIGTYISNINPVFPPPPKN
jgi:pilus assembly protein Flp/PilA